MFSIYDSIASKKRPLIMGVLNVTPDSFFDSGKSFFVDDAVNRAKQIEAEGADILDIGGCSTAPGNAIVSLNEELERLKNVLPAVLKSIKIPVSVDTFRFEVACFALEQGAVIINDESGCFSEKMAMLVKQYGASWIFMHTGNKSSSQVAEYENGVVASVLEFFNSMKHQALGFGINENQLCYDYGIGFGKSREDDLTLLKNTNEFAEFKPLLVGVSNKRVIGQAVNKGINERLYGTISAQSIAAFLGADVIRTHNVEACRDALAVCECIKKGGF